MNSEHINLKHCSLPKRFFALFIVLSFCALLLPFASFTKVEAKQDDEKPSASSTDDYEVLSDLPETKPTRVVALSGSFAEIWYLAGGDLIGVTEDVIQKERIPSAEDYADVGPNNEPNIEQIISLQPDWILLSQKMKAHHKFGKVFEDAGIPIAYCKVETFEDYLELLKKFTSLTGNEEAYETYGLKVQTSIQELLNLVDQNIEDGPSYLLLRALTKGPKAMTRDHQVLDMLDNLKCHSIMEGKESKLEDLSLEEIYLQNPDYIFVITTGRSDQALDVFREQFKEHEIWDKLKAVQDDHVYLLPTKLFHYKPNEKWAESYRYLAEILYPELFENQSDTTDAPDVADTTDATDTAEENPPLDDSGLD